MDIQTDVRWSVEALQKFSYRLKPLGPGGRTQEPSDKYHVEQGRGSESLIRLLAGEAGNLWYSSRRDYRIKIEEN